MNSKGGGMERYLASADQTLLDFGPDNYVTAQQLADFELNTNMSLALAGLGSVETGPTFDIEIPRPLNRPFQELSQSINQWLADHKTLKLRQATEDDLKTLVDVDLVAFKTVYKHYELTEQELKNELLDKFARRFQKIGGGWITILEKDRRVLGFIAGCPTNKPPEDFVSWEDTTDNGTLETTYDPNGQYLYAVSLSVLPEGSKDDGQDMLMLSLISKIIAGNYHAYFESRLPGLKRWMLSECRDKGISLRSLPEDEKQALAQKYFELNTTQCVQEPIDPLLKIYHEMGCKFVKLVPNAYQDEMSMNYGVVAVYENPLPDKLRRLKIARLVASRLIAMAAGQHWIVKRLF